MNLPVAPPKYSQQDQANVRYVVRMADSQNFKRGRDVELVEERLILSSPDGSRWAISVDNAGVLSAVAL